MSHTAATGKRQRTRCASLFTVKTKTRQFLVLGSMSIVYLGLVFSGILRVHQDQHQDQHHNKHGSNFIHSQSNPATRWGLGLCLLIKDDNELLPEFLAYHYHALQMRTLIVAVDPSSQTSPTHILQRFQNILPHLTIHRWKDHVFMPTDFLKGDFSKVPDFIQRNKNNATHSFWHSSKSKPNNTEIEIQHALQNVNNHCFRQVKFAGECIRHLYFHSNRRWITHIDTDEFIVLHPNILKHPTQARKDSHNYIQQAQYQKVALPPSTNERKNADSSNHNNHPSHSTSRRPWETLQPNSLLQLLEAWIHRFPLSGNTKACVQIRRLFYGGKEDERNDDTTTTTTTTTKNKKNTIATNHTTTMNDRNQNSSTIMQTFQAKRFETLRWKYHAKSNAVVNGYPKVLLDLTQLAQNDTLLQPGRPATSVHRLSSHLCEAGNPKSLWNHRPLVANHYLGSLERYLAKGDFRRNRENHQAKSANAIVSNNGSIQWLQQWLPQMTLAIGLENMKLLLPEYVDNRE